MGKILDHDILLSFYGDDFTGSTDVMESLALNGIPSALFLDPPSAEEVKNFRLKYPLDEKYGNTLDAFGVAGISRSLTPGQMDEELPPIFEKISRIPSDFFHYKVCSTFDSSPAMGNIGHASELALSYFRSDHIPLIVGAPSLNRFLIFGNLFARVGTVTYRLDRHPTMSKHPITPMKEADLRLHLGQQTGRKVKLFDIFSLQQKEEQQLTRFRELVEERGCFILFDTIDRGHLLQTGKILMKTRSGNTQLLVGSSGTEYALAAYLQKTGKIRKPDYSTEAGSASQIMVMAGSAAPTTRDQIEWAISKGFESVRIDTVRAIDPDTSSKEQTKVVERALKAIDQGRSVVAFSALGPDDPAIEKTREKLKEVALQSKGGHLQLAEFQGEALKMILERTGIKRVIVAGGDTSGYVSRALGIYALETRIPVAPGAPLCTAHSKEKIFDGLEISLKGGQNGDEKYFESILKGKKI